MKESKSFNQIPIVAAFLLFTLGLISSCSPKPHFTNTIFKAKVWPSDGTQFSFAEESLQLPKTGVCVSG